MSKSMNPIAAPKTLRYEPDAGLPVAIEAKSNRRYFYPTNGDKFGPDQTNVIRMTLNSNSFIDFSHSYLQFTVKNTSGGNLAVDSGMPFFSRLQIMSGGQELEDIQEWGRLYSILQGVQGSRLTCDEHSLTQHEPFASVSADSAIATTDVAASAIVAGDVKNDAGATIANTDIDDTAVVATVNQAITNGINTGLADLRTKVNTATADIVDTKVRNALNAQTTSDIAPYQFNAATQVSGVAPAGGASITYNIPILSAFFNIEKYFPLLLTEQGLDLYFYCEQPANVGVWAAAVADIKYEISSVRYVAHEVNLDDAFVNQMKASMQATGGVLSLSSTTYRHNQITGVGALNSDINDELNISCRVKSLKGMLIRPQPQCINNDKDRFCISVGQSCGFKEGQFRIGSVLYPQSSLKFSDTNRGELFNEVRKCFGTIGSYAHGSKLNSQTFRPMVDTDTCNAAAANGQGLGPKHVRTNFLIAYDFETFAKSATESGLNVADRALPVSFNYIADKVGAAGVKNAGNTDEEANQKIRYDTFAMCDCIIYIDLMGKITTRI